MPGQPLVRKEILDTALEIAIRLAVVGLLLYWCLLIFRPFIVPMIWGIIIAVAARPLFGRLLALTGGRRGLAAGLFSLLAIVLVVIPTFRIADSVVHSSVQLGEAIEAETLVVPPPRESVRGWPLIGNPTYEAWALASTNLDQAVERFAPQIRAFGAWLLAFLRGVAGAVLQTIIALIIAGFMLTYAEPGERALRSVLYRLGGARGEGIVQMSRDTISSVFKGVLGVALVQAALTGVGLFLAGVPAWGIWTLLVLVLAVVQLPPLIVLGPIAIWVFANVDSTLWGLVFLVYALAVSISDTFLKPLFLGRGVAVPMPVILIGAIGGVILHGIIGLFIGAIVLAIGHELFMAWVEEQEPTEALAGAAGASAGG